MYVYITYTIISYIYKYTYLLCIFMYIYFQYGMHIYLQSYANIGLHRYKFPIIQLLLNLSVIFTLNDPTGLMIIFLHF